MVQIHRTRRRIRNANNNITSILILYTLTFLLILVVLLFSSLLYFNDENSIDSSLLDLSKIKKGGDNGSKRRRNGNDGLHAPSNNTPYYGRVFPAIELADHVRKEMQQIQSTTTTTNSLIYGDQFLGGSSRKGKDHQINQDRAVVVSPFRTTVDEEDGRRHGDDFFMAIFDGHGDLGHEVSQFLLENFHKSLSRKLRAVRKEEGEEENVIKRILVDTFLEMDESLPKMTTNNNNVHGDNDNGDEGYTIGENGGSTASTILRYGSKLYFANVGDSLSFLARRRHDHTKGKTTILYQNRMDKPHIPSEKERIERNGGKVFIPPHPVNSRVMAYNPVRRETMGLAMSRSIGDSSHGRVGVIAVPIVDVVDLDELKGREEEDVGGGDDGGSILFVVVSSDGVYDHRRPQFVAEHFSNHFFGDENSEESGNVGDYPVAMASAEMIDLATPKDPMRYRDDMTVMALRIQ